MALLSLLLSGRLRSTALPVAAQDFYQALVLGICTAFSQSLGRKGIFGIAATGPFGITYGCRLSTWVLLLRSNPDGEGGLGCYPHGG